MFDVSVSQRWRARRTCQEKLWISGQRLTTRAPVHRMSGETKAAPLPTALVEGAAAMRLVRSTSGIGR